MHAWGLCVSLPITVIPWFMDGGLIWYALSFWLYEISTEMARLLVPDLLLL